MKLIVFPLASILSMVFSCTTPHTHGHEPEEPGLEALTYTKYTEKTELFVEFQPLVVGHEIRFAAHFTKLGENFKPFIEGTITLTLTVNGKSISIKSTEPSNPGIYRLLLKPDLPGMGTLVFDIQTQEFVDKITIDSIQVYPDDKTAIENQFTETGSSDIIYLKEQAWNVEFSNAPVKKQIFSDIIKTSGQIISAPGDEMIVTAKASGIVLLVGNKTIIGSRVSIGTNLFTITGGDLTEGNMDAKYKEANASYKKSKADYDRAKELVKDKIISEKDFQEVKLKLENSQILFNTIARNYSVKGHSITSTMSGFIKNIFVTEGQYIAVGAPMATISKNKNLLLQANVSQKNFDKLSSISSANFRTPGGEKFISTLELGGKVVSFGKSASANSPFIPIIFEVSNRGDIIPGAVVEVLLKSLAIPNALIIPVSSLIEEQGSFFVFVQIGGESFQKREVKLGASDGLNVQVLSGVAEGERVVTKGAYQIKLSVASGALPAHGHEH